MRDGCDTLKKQISQARALAGQALCQESWARAIPARHLYLPALARLRDRFTAGRELAADRAALASHGRTPLAGALVKVTEGPAWAVATPIAAMGTGALLEARITQLETGTEPPTPATGTRSAATIGTAAGALLLVSPPPGR